MCLSRPPALARALERRISVHAAVTAVLSDVRVDEAATAFSALRARYEAPVPADVAERLHFPMDQPFHGIDGGDGTLLRAVREDAVEHMREAADLGHPQAGLRSASQSPDLLQSVYRVAASFHSPGSLREQRRVASVTLARESEALRPVSRRCHLLMSRSVRKVAGSFHVALLAAMARSVGWADERIAHDFVSGFPTVGNIPSSNVPSFRHRETEATVSQADAPNAAHNGAVRKRLLSRGVDQSTIPLWEASLAESSSGSGLIHGPFYSTNLLDRKFGGPQSWRCMERFAVWQQRPNGTWKLRPCDNAASSLHNDMTSMHETISCVSAAFPAEVASLFVEALGAGPGWSMAHGTDDIDSAYRRVPTGHPSYGVVAQLDPKGRVAYFIVPGLNFGLASAVNQFNRFPSLIVAFMRSVFGVVVAHYFDDYDVCEPTYAGTDGQRLLGEVHAELGILLAPGKHVPMAASNVFLGVTSEFGPRFEAERIVTMSPKPGRVESLTRLLQPVVESGSISTVDASSLRGKLMFLLLTSAYGRLGRAPLSALSEVPSTRARRTHELGASTVMALQVVLAILPVAPPRAIDLRRAAVSASRPPIVIWTDAMWTPGATPRGRMGFVVYIPPGRDPAYPEGRYLYSSLDADEAILSRMDYRETYIGQLELLAAILVYASLPALLHGEYVLHFIDNTSALAGLIAGSSKVPDSARIIHAFQVLNLSIMAVPWFAYVASKANISDLPSRAAFAEMAAAIRELQPGFCLTRDWVDPVLPAIPESWAAYAVSVFGESPAPPRQRKARRQKRTRVH
jgi:hypothetical protein